MKRCILCDAHAEQDTLAKAPALKAAPADEPETTLAERAAQAAEFKTALANTRVTPQAQQALADAMARHRDPKAAQEAAQAHQEAGADRARVRCGCGCGGWTTDRTTPQPHSTPGCGTPDRPRRRDAWESREVCCRFDGRNRR